MNASGSSYGALGGGTSVTADRGGGGQGRVGNPAGAYPNNSNAVGEAGVPNTGGGQGGGSGGNFNNGFTDLNGRAGAGGSGVVIFQIPTSIYTGTYTGSNVIVETSGSNTILKFASSGTYTG
jgi:hypothetical protein